MLNAPNEPLPGQPLRAFESAAVIRYLKSTAPRSGPGTLSATGSGGSTRRPITPRPAYQWPLGGSGTPAVIKPFQKLTFTAVQGSTTQWMATFQPGDVNYNIFPKIINLPMWVLQPDPTTGAAPYNFPALTVNNGDTIYLLGDVSAGLLTNVNIYSSASLPDESDEETTYIIGTCDPMTGGFTQISTGNLEYFAAATYFSGGDRLIRHEWDVQPT